MTERGPQTPRKPYWLQLLLPLLFLPTFALAITIHVPAKAPTIAAGIDLAAPGDTVLVATGTYFERDIAIKSGVLLRSEGGDPAGVTVHAQQLGRVFKSVGQANVKIEGFTFTGGIHSGGGGAIILDAAVVVSLTDCVFASNSSTLYGGAVYFNAEMPHYSLSLTRCTFVDNHAVGFDGAALNVRCTNVGTVTITDCRFETNVADYWGGAIEFANCTATVTGTVFDGNTAHNLGGAIFMQDSTVELIQCTFAQNQADDFGGAIFQSNGALTVTSCTFKGNGADNQGGCLYFNGDAYLTMSNTILAFSSWGAAAGGPGDISGSCNDVFGNVGGDFVGPFADLEGTDDNFSSDPIFCGAENPEAPFSLDEASHCTAENNPNCGLVGAWPVGCSGGIAGVETYVPAAASLAPGRPNPFNPQTTIAFTLARDGQAEIGVYDLTGRLVKVLANHTYPAGDHAVVWNGKDAAGREVPSGSYIVRLETESAVESRKISLIR